MIEYLTSAGSRMLARMVSGDIKITFTKIIMGDGWLSASIPAKSVTDVINPVATLDIESVAVSAENDITITSVFDNKAITEGFYYREKGIYATDGTSEILFIYGNDGDDAEWIEPASSSVVEKQINSLIALSQETSINVTVKSGLYALASDLEALKTSVEEVDKKVDDAVILVEECNNRLQVISGLTILPEEWDATSLSYTILNELFKTSSVIDIYYASGTDLTVSYSQADGSLTLTVDSVPTSSVVIDAIKVVNA